MIASYDDLTPDALRPLGFDNSAAACHILQDMAGHDVPDTAFDRFLQVLLAALGGNADPDRAVANLGRWAGAVGSRASAYALLASHPAATRMLLTLFAASQFFADLLIHTPEYLEVLTNPTIRDRGRGVPALRQDLSRRVAIAKTPNAKRDALRRFKPPEILRIGVRDLLGYAAMPETVQAISDFADVCVGMALEICAAERDLTDPQFAVIALGKLGGQELNYASDIDLIFVHGDALPTSEAVKLAEGVRGALAKATDAGFVFRVDLRLRPEGRFGPVSRSLESCRAYYESWAEPWERQALMKARFIAGDAALGAAFAEMAEAFVYRPRVEDSFVESIRENKRRLERKVAGEGDAESNVKEGIGGIRDIEFLVQLMQLVAGGTHPALRGGNTLRALDALSAARLLTGSERDILQESYVFLRGVEHRLQLRDERPVRTLPRDPGELNKFGRRLGYTDGAAFWNDYRRHAGRVQALFLRLFYEQSGAQALSPGHEMGEIGEWAMSPDDPAAWEKLLAALAGYGFAAPDTAGASLKRDIIGSEYGGIAPDTRERFAALIGPLLDASAATDDPDTALRGLQSLADAVPSRAALYQSLTENPPLLRRLCSLAAGGPALWQILLRHLEFFDLLADDEAMDQPPAFPAEAGSAAELAQAALRARLTTGARDIWKLAPPAQIMAEVTGAAEFTLGQALALARRETGFLGRFAVIGLGKLGGGELGYGSDLDVLYVAEAGELAAAARLAERLQHLLRGGLAQYGVSLELDARLRPDGRSGALVLDPATYKAYYTQSAATWERQALMKARPVAGDPALGQEFLALSLHAVYGDPPTEGQIAEIRAMKRRIERERLKDPHDLKLGPGGLADIEWTAQLLQLRLGMQRPRLRVPGTLRALQAMRDDALITQSDWETLSDAYLRLAHLRNRLFLRSGVSRDAPPFLPDALARRMSQARAVCLRLFYGEESRT